MAKPDAARTIRGPSGTEPSQDWVSGETGLGYALREAQSALMTWGRSLPGVPRLSRGAGSVFGLAERSGAGPDAKDAAWRAEFRDAENASRRASGTTRRPALRTLPSTLHFVPRLSVEGRSQDRTGSPSFDPEVHPPAAGKGPNGQDERAGSSSGSDEAALDPRVSLGALAGAAAPADALPGAAALPAFSAPGPLPQDAAALAEQHVDLHREEVALLRSIDRKLTGSGEVGLG